LKSNKNVELLLPGVGFVFFRLYRPLHGLSATAELCFVVIVTVVMPANALSMLSNLYCITLLLKKGTIYRISLLMLMHTM
jgi:hypothetical protein